MDDYDTFSAAQDEQISSTQLDPLAPTDPTLRAEQEKDKTKIKKRTAAISLDPKLLLGDKGLSRLRRQGKVMKFYGKGREDEDLKRIMEFYQMWAHSLYPRLNMKDFSDRVVKVCSKRQCKETLNVWRQELVENKSVESMEGGFTGITIEDDANETNASRSAGVDDIWGSAANPPTDPFFQSLSPSSPPPSVSTASTDQQSVSLTEEQKRKIDENRLKALAKRRAQVSNPTSTPSNQTQEMHWDELEDMEAQAEEEYEDPAEEYV
ncbi:hypothetical protein K450DRAFT_243433 [Umbelopsis ramanniana AG]|uniref:Chromosome segregation in meiosis protein n=1 Tax=Umbelopsis ramanniana AG TaxID=1314678 RepID=A0AAD5E9L9_UMBRA|nr:uncharacterized protein K450DRAFT_243433 [Umbelopsis ramanniana AG]KAI8579237.1 hypothetical protein K450DRAFT_243433 [Umbelopsis ramanniana AG]